jgi:sugar (pentulose or hexulose) kinase
METVDGAEFGAKGAVINAAVAIGAFASFAEGVARFVRVQRRFEPDPEAHAAYNEIFKVFRDGYDTVWDLWDQRAVLEERLRSHEDRSGGGPFGHA